MLKHSFRLVKVVECGDLGYTSVVELSTIPEEWIDHPQFGRCRITSCEEVESHCGHDQGCFTVTEITEPVASIMERVQSYKRNGYKLIVWNE